MRDWERLLAAERRVQSLVPGAVLVGGTATGLHVGHRLSLDGDHVLTDMRIRFDEILQCLEVSSGWRTHLLRPPVLVLGEMDGFRTGLRQLRRGRALDTELVEGLVVPTLPEMARIKAWLLLERNTVRDYVDTVAIFEALGDAGVVPAMSSFDAAYAGRRAEGTPLVELVSQLAAAQPGDEASVDLAGYRGIIAPWDRWSHVRKLGRSWAARLAVQLLRGDDRREP